MRILLIDDDESLAEVLRQALTEQHYRVETVADGETGWEMAEAFEYDLILLDLILPKLDGIRFCQRLRSERDRSSPSLNRHTPILLMTAQEGSTDTAIGLDAGADDYLVKPFDLSELLARVRALLRRGNLEQSPLLSWGRLQLDPGVCIASYDGQVLHLTAKEYSLLELFLRRPRQIFSHNTLIEHLWALDDIPTDNAIRAQIKGLRKKLKQAGAEDAIATVYGLGYRLKEGGDQGGGEMGRWGDGEVRSDQMSSSTPPHPHTPTPTWEQYRQPYCDRLSVIEQAIAAISHHTLTQSLRQQAQQEAHTLKGSLGLFGLEEAARLCREIEQFLNAADALSRTQVERLSELARSVRQQLETHKPDQTRISTADVAVPLEETPRFVLLIVEDDAALAEQVAQVAIAQNIQTITATNLAQARAAIAQTPPQIVLLDLTFADSVASGLELLEELAIRQPSLPVVVFTAQEALVDRVRVVQLGGKGFLQKPIAPAQVVDAIAQVMQHSTTRDATLLVVDDDPAILATLRTLLEPWGFQVTLLDDPTQFWETLERTHPDLLILDIEMPAFNGIDLCQVVRNDVRWGELPILILSAHNDDQTLQQVFMAGADDYVCKPIRAVELVARVLGRLERSKLRQKLRWLEG